MQGFPAGDPLGERRQPLGLRAGGAGGLHYSGIGLESQVALGARVIHLAVRVQRLRELPVQPRRCGGALYGGAEECPGRFDSPPCGAAVPQQGRDFGQRLPAGRRRGPLRRRGLPADRRQPITGRGGSDAYGIWLGSTGTFVDNNAIRGGCAPIGTASTRRTRTRGSRTTASSGSRPPTAPRARAQRAAELRDAILVAAGGHEIDVHSNDVDGGGFASGCTSRGIQLDVTGAAPASGIFRNNIVRAGVCAAARYGFVELVAAANPRGSSSTTIRIPSAAPPRSLDKGASALTTAAAVDALPGTTANGTLSADAKFVAYPGNLHLSAGSPCDGAGTPAGAPATDMDGAPRDPVKPDIGADELLICQPATSFRVTGRCTVGW